MCGRYQFTEEVPELTVLTARLKEQMGDVSFKTGEVFPTNTAVVLIGQGERLIPTLQSWGFPAYGRSGVVINARAETAHEKRMFHNSLIERRCIIPTSGFFEWTHSGEKRKYLIRRPEHRVLYLAGIYNEQAKFVILTQSANTSMQGIHNRMPIILGSGELKRWVLNPNSAFPLMRRIGPRLEPVEIA